MKINIVTEDSPGWVLRWISESYAQYWPNTAVSTTPDNNADINFYVNYELLQEKTTIDIGYFTHKEDVEPKKSNFENAAKYSDWCISMCEKTSKYLPRKRTSTHLVPPDPQFMKEDIVFGVVGTEKSSGRKRYKWIEELRKIDGITIKMTNGEYAWKDLPKFYRDIDYLLITSDNEGGPLPLVEALAMGKPVISTHVGFSDEYTTIKYNTFEELLEIIDKLIIKKDAWKTSADEIYQIFETVYTNKKNQKSNVIERLLKKISR